MPLHVRRRHALGRDSPRSSSTGSQATQPLTSGECSELIAKNFLMYLIAGHLHEVFDTINVITMTGDSLVSAAKI